MNYGKNYLFYVMISKMLRICGSLIESRPISAYSLSAIRIWVCLMLLINVLWNDLSSASLIPRELALIDKMGVPGVLFYLPIRMDSFVQSELALAIFQWTTITLLFCSMIGFFTRITLPLSAIFFCVFSGLMRLYVWQFHTMVVPLYILIVLVFSGSGRSLSIDGLIRKKQGKNSLSIHTKDKYVRYCIWVVIAIPYFLAGLSKIRNGGIGWLGARSFKTTLMQTNLNPMHFDFDFTLKFFDLPDWVFSGMAFSGVLTEILFVTILFCTICRKVFPFMAVLLHISILFFQNILFIDLILIQFIFYDYSFLAKWLGLKELNLTNTGMKKSSVVRFAPVVIVGVFSLLWVFRVQSHPLSAWQMFSGQKNGKCKYFKLYAELEDGSVSPLRIEEYIPYYQDTRYRKLVTRSLTKNAVDFNLLLDNIKPIWDGKHESKFNLNCVTSEFWIWDIDNHKQFPGGKMLKQNRYCFDN